MHMRHDPPQSCTLVLSFGLFAYIGDVKVLDWDLGKDHVPYGAVRHALKKCSEEVFCQALSIWVAKL
jgi:hypothetical protein